MLAVHAVAFSGQTITGDYNGTALTQASVSGSAGGTVMYVFYLLNPISGTNAITLTYSGSGSLKYGMASSFTGVKQSGQPDAVNNNTSTGTNSVSTTVTTVANNSWITAAAYGGNAAGFAGTGAGTVRFWGTGGATSPLGWNGVAIVDTNGAITPAAATAIGLSMTGNNDMAIAAMSFSPAPNVNSNFLAFM